MPPIPDEANKPKVAKSTLGKPTIVVRDQIPNKVQSLVPGLVSSLSRSLAEGTFGPVVKSPSPSKSLANVGEDVYFSQEVIAWEEVGIPFYFLDRRGYKERVLATPCQVIGPFLIHRHDNQDGLDWHPDLGKDFNSDGKWVLTDRQSGCAIMAFPKREDCVKMATSLGIKCEGLFGRWRQREMLRRILPRWVKGWVLECGRLERWVEPPVVEDCDAED